MGYKGNDMNCHISELLAIVDKLACMGQKLDQELVMSFLLSSMPESFNPIVMSLESRPEADLNLDIVKDRLLNEYNRRNEANDNNSSTSYDKNIALKTKNFKYNRNNNKKSNNNKINKFCDHCEKQGHVKDDCWHLNKVDEKSQKAKMVTDETTNCCFCTSSNTDKNWHIDSGATSHMCSNKDLFDEFKESVEKIIIADGNTLEAKGKGTVYLKIYNEGDIKTIKLLIVLYVPKIEGNLISVSKIVEKGFNIVFSNKFCFLEEGRNKIKFAKVMNGVYLINVFNENARLSTENIDIELLHRRLGHRNYNDIRSMIKSDVFKNININNKSHGTCNVCIEGKLHKLPFNNSKSKTNAILDLVHSDVCGPMSIITPSKNKYYVSFIDDFSRYSFIYLLKQKSEVAEKFKEFSEMMKTMINKTIKILRSDNGG